MSITNHVTPSVFSRYNVRVDGIQEAAFERQGVHLAAQRGTTSTPVPLAAREETR